MSTQLVLRTELRAILNAWQAGDVAAPAVHAWAEERYANSSFQAEDEVANEVLGWLDMLNLNLTTLEDVPALLRMLDVPASDVHVAIALLDAHLATVHMERRKRECVADPFYALYAR